MRQITIEGKDAGQRFDKFLAKYLSLAPKSFLYKMLRKKNIVLNEKKAEGKEILCLGDKISLYLSEETITKFQSQLEIEEVACDFSVLYEDDNVLIVNKPIGVLSQKAKKEDISLVEMISFYLYKTKALTKDDLTVFSPSVCNRLDRNTSGIVVAGKSLAGLQKMTELFRTRTIQKYYLCIVKGELTSIKKEVGFLYKDESKNQVKVLSKESYELLSKIEQEDYCSIQTKYRPLCCHKGVTLLEIQLLTGKPHQIRAHLAFLGYPIAGDQKYGNLQWNEQLKREYGVSSQMLHAYRLVFPELSQKFKGLSKREIYCKPPQLFEKIQRGLLLNMKN